MKMKQWIEKNSFVWPLAGTIILWIMIVAVSGRFSMNQLFSCATLASFALLLGMCQMIVMTSGNGAIDLSATYVLTLGAYISCSLMTKNIFLGIIGAVAAGAVVGFVNGCINIYLKVPAMITTLATGYIVFTIILIAAPSMKTLPNKTFVKFITTNFGGLTVMTILCLLISAALAVLLYKTKFGKNLHAVGQKREAAKYAGISVPFTVITTFALSGAIAGFAGVLCGAFIGGAFQDMGTAYFLPAVAAALVGGTLASGGRSNVLGVVFGALMMSFMSTFLNAANLAPGLQRLIQGAVLVLILVASVSKKD